MISYSIITIVSRSSTGNSSSSSSSSGSSSSSNSVIVIIIIIIIVLIFSLLYLSLLLQSSAVMSWFSTTWYYIQYFKHWGRTYITICIYSPSRASYGVFIVRNLEKIDLVITASHSTITVINSNTCIHYVNVLRSRGNHWWATCKYASLRPQRVNVKIIFQIMENMSNCVCR